MYIRRIIALLLELAFNHWLAGESGAKRVLKDRLGRSIENVASIRPPHQGKDLTTSIDLRLQYLAYRTLKSAIKTYNARSGSIVVLDVKTGEVLAMVNQPTYNPNDRSQFSAERYRNRAITDIFEPGSSLKPLVVAAALESGQLVRPFALSIPSRWSYFIRVNDTGPAGEAARAFAGWIKGQLEEGANQ